MAFKWWENYQRTRNTVKVWEELSGGDVSKIPALLQYGLMLDKRSIFGDCSVLDTAIIESRNNVAITNDLIFSIADAAIAHSSINTASGRNGWTALSWAASIGSIPLIEGLLKRGAHIDNGGEQARYYGLVSGHPANPVLAAAQMGHEDAVLFLLERSAAIVSPTMLLRYAAQNQMPRLLDICLKNSGFLQDGLDRALLACLSNEKPDLAIAEKLLKAGASPNTPDLTCAYHDTALHKAARRNLAPEFSQLLLVHGANPVLVNKKNHTALEIIESQSSELAAALRKSVWFDYPDHNVVVRNRMEDNRTHIKDIFNFEASFVQTIRATADSKITVGNGVSIFDFDERAVSDAETMMMRHRQMNP